MKRFLVLSLLVPFAAFAEETEPTRVDFTSQPVGASVSIDGVDRGVTPITVFDLAPGRHRVKFWMPGYEDRNRFYNVEPNRPMQQSVVLNPVKGILLLKSEPSECNITIDGLSAGVTPRLITALDVKDVHHVVLEKAGFRPAEFDVKFNGRRPVVRTEKMLLDAGVIEITTDPSGAEVMVNGVPRGTSPVTVRDVPKGSAIIKVRKDGFEEESREVRVVAGDSLALPILLKGLPGTLFLSSVPDGARFYVNDEFRGVAPVALHDLAPGDYTVRAELKGYGTEVRKVIIGNGDSPRVEFRLSNVMGRIEVVTSPVGAQVFLDGRLVGTTRSSDEKASKSDPLAIENVIEGEHVLMFKADGYTQVVRHPKIENSKTEQVSVRMRRFFRPDVVLHTSTGEIRGKLVKNGAEYIEIEVSLGVNRTIPRENVRRLEFLEDK